MMPTCYYKRCRKVSELRLGEIDTGDIDGYGKPWPQTVYICSKHYAKILKLLQLNRSTEEANHKEVSNNEHGE